MDDTRVGDSEVRQETENAEVLGTISESESATGDNTLEAVPNEAGKLAAELALGKIKVRRLFERNSYSNRNQEFGKMINCSTCGLRHRQKQEFRTHSAEDGIKRATKIVSVIECGSVRYATGRYDLRDPKPLLIAGDTPETAFDRTVEADIPAKQIHLILGAKAFAKKRLNPHKNQKQQRYIRIVRNNLPDEYTEEDLTKAREIASVSMGLKKKKTYGYMPSPKKGENGNTDTVQTT